MSLLSNLDSFLQNYLHLKITPLKKGPGIEKNRYLDYQKDFVKFDISKYDTVLDIGSGSDPFPLATHLADLYPNKTTHRAGSAATKDDRPFTVCNVEDTPFKDKEFDFVYCAHVLEHTNDPAKACDELMRIAKRGYIETPTRTSDIMLNFIYIENHHKWHLVKTDMALFFFEYDPNDRRNTENNFFFEQLHSKFQNPFQSLFLKQHDLFDNMFLWENSFNYYVFDHKGKLIKTNEK